MSGAGREVLAAPAKLTLSLRITGRRGDGYHLIDAEMVTLELADELTVTPRGSRPDLVLTASGPFAEGMPLDDTNLIARALDAVGQRDVAVHVDKQIPHGGGLGGASADAAAILRWAHSTDDGPTAARLGADVPFCVVGGRARVTGIGEIVEPLAPRALDVTLVVPPLVVSTPAVYRAWDDLGGRPGDAADEPVNDLEAAALAVQPALATWRDRIIEATGRRPMLAGSGATWFVLGHDGGLAEVLAGATVILTATR